MDEKNKISFTDLEEALECAVCHKQLTNPKHLPCFHSFCKFCLDDLLLFDKDGSATLECPYRCDEVVTISSTETTDSLKNNYSLHGILSLLKRKRNCQADCRDQTLLCLEHQAKARWICLECKDTLACVYCVKRQHKDHAFVQFEEHACAVKEDIISRVEALQSHLSKNPIGFSYKNELRKIKAFRVSLRKELKSRKFLELLRVYQELEVLEESSLYEFDQKVIKFEEIIQNRALKDIDLCEEVSKLRCSVGRLYPADAFINRVTYTNHVEEFASITCFDVTLLKTSKDKPLGVSKVTIENKTITDQVKPKIFQWEFENNEEISPKHHGDFERGITKDFSPDHHQPVYTHTDVRTAIDDNDYKRLDAIATLHPYLLSKKFMVTDAVTIGKSKILQTLISLNPNAVFETDSYYGRTPLMWACYKGHYECVEQLLLCGGDVTINFRDRRQRTALYYASNRNYLDCVELLNKFQNNKERDVIEAIRVLSNY